MPDYNHVYTRLAVGSRPPPDVSLRQHFDLLVVVDLAEIDPKRYDIPVIYYPFHDGSQIPQGAVDLAAVVAQRWHAGARVLITCAAGRNRSGLVAALVIRNITRKAGVDALWRVQTHRPFALTNPYFASWLYRLPRVRTRQAAARV